MAWSRQGYWSKDVCGLTCIECQSVKYICIYIYTHNTHIHTHTHTHIYIYTHTYIYTNTHTHKVCQESNDTECVAQQLAML